MTAPPLDLYEQFQRDRQRKQVPKLDPVPAPDLYAQFRDEQEREEPPHVSTASDIAAQPFAAAANLVTTAGEGALRLGGHTANLIDLIKRKSPRLGASVVDATPGLNILASSSHLLERGADALRARRAAVNEATAPSTTSGKVANVVSNIVAQALPAVATGGAFGVVPGAAASAGVTGIQSQAGRDASITGLVGDLTDNRTINRIADNPFARTATDVALDVGLSGASHKVSELLAARRAAKATANAGVLDAVKRGMAPAAEHAEGAGSEAATSLARQFTAETTQVPHANAAAPATVDGFSPTRPLRVPIEEPLGGVVGGPTRSDVEGSSVIDLVKRRARTSDPDAALNHLKRDVPADTRPPIDLADGPVRQPPVNDLDRARMARGDMPADPALRSQVESLYEQYTRQAGFPKITPDDVLAHSEEKGYTVARSAAALRSAGHTVPEDVEQEAAKLAMSKPPIDPATLPPRDKFGNLVESFDDQRNRMRAEVERERPASVLELVKRGSREADSPPAAAGSQLSRADRIIVQGEGQPAVRADDGQIITRKTPAEHGDLIHHAESTSNATFDSPDADVRGWILDGKFVSVRDLDSETIEGVHYTKAKPAAVADDAPAIQRADHSELLSFLDHDIGAGSLDEDLSMARLTAKELARRSGQSPEEIIARRLEDLFPHDEAARANRLRDLADAGVFEDPTPQPGVFQVDHPQHGLGVYWRASDGTMSPPRYVQRGETIEDVLTQMYEQFDSLAPRLRAPLQAVDGGAEAMPGGVRSIRTASGRLPKSLTKFSNDELSHEWARLAEQNAVDEAQHSAIQESGYRAAYDELPRTEKLGRKGQEDLPDADGMISGERLAADNRSISGYNRAGIIRAARERAIRRITAELERRGVDYGLSGETDGGVVPFSNPMFHPGTIRKAFSTRLGRSAATAGVGMGLQDSEDEKLRATGRGLVGLAALHAVGIPRIRAGSEYAGGRIVDALKDSPAGRWTLNALSHDILADPKVKQLIDAYDEAIAGARARAAELSKQAKALGPSGDRAVSDVIEKESFEPLTTDQTAVMAVAQRISDEFTALGREKVGAGLLSAETVAKREGSYLPRLYAEHLGERVRIEPGQSVLGSTPQKIRIKPDGMREDLTAEARDALGEIRESSFRTAYGVEKGYRDVAAAKLFDSLRDMPGIIHPRFAEAVDALRVAKQSGEEGAIEAAKTALAGFSSRFSHGADGFRRLPDTPGMGVLRGAVVRADVADYLDGVNSFGAKGGKAQDLLTLWKRIHTTLNLPTHVGNVASNSVIAHMVGLPLWKQPPALIEAMADFDRYGASTKFLAEKGILSHGLPTSSEGVPAAGRSLRSALTQLASTTRPTTAAVLAEKGVTPSAAPFRAVGKVASALEAAYAKEDAVYRVAVFNKVTREGMHADDAAALVDKAFVSYDTRSPLLRVIKNTASPFVMYPVRAIPFVTGQIVEHPWRWATLAAMWGGMDQAAQARVGEIAQKDLAPSDRTNQSLGYLAPGFTQIPFKGKGGEKYGVDVARFTPFSAVTGAVAPGTATYAAFGDRVPPILQPSGPILDIGARVANRDPYTGAKLIKPGDGSREKVLSVLKGAASLGLPSMLSFHAPRVATDIAENDPHAAVNDGLAFVGLRPRAVRPGLQPLSEQRDFEEARAQILYDLRRDLRTNKSPSRAITLQLKAEQRLRDLARERSEQVREHR